MNSRKQLRLCANGTSCDQWTVRTLGGVQLFSLDPSKSGFVTARLFFNNITTEQFTPRVQKFLSIQSDFRSTETNDDLWKTSHAHVKRVDRGCVKSACAFENLLGKALYK